MYVSASYDLGSGTNVSSSHVASSLPPSYTSLENLVSEEFRATSLFHHPIWSSSVTPTSGSFVSNVATVSQPSTQHVVYVGQMSVALGLSSPSSLSTITDVPPLSGKYTV